MIIVSNEYVADPVVSVLIFCYNQEDLLAGAVNSVLAQDFSMPFEVIIFDDASTDGTQAICRDLQDKNKNKIKLVFRERNLGAMQNFKQALSCPLAEYVTFFAGDDYWNNTEKLSLQFQYLKTHPEVSIVHSRYKILHMPQGEITEAEIPENPIDKNALLEKGNFIGALTVMIRNSCIQKALADGIFDQNFLMEDYPLWLYATEDNELGFINEFTAVWRKSEESLSNSKSISKMLVFQLSIQDIRLFFAKRQSAKSKALDSIIESYRYILYRAFINGEPKLAKKSLARLKQLYRPSWKEQLLGNCIVQKPLLILYKLRGKYRLSKV